MPIEHTVTLSEEDGIAYSASISQITPSMARVNSILASGCDPLAVTADLLCFAVDAARNFARSDDLATHIEVVLRETEALMNVRQMASNRKEQLLDEDALSDGLAPDDEDNAFPF